MHGVCYYKHLIMIHNYHHIGTYMLLQHQNHHYNKHLYHIYNQNNTHFILLCSILKDWHIVVNYHLS